MYTFVNITNRNNLVESQRRRTLVIDGSTVRPEDERRFKEPTQEICRHLDNGSILVERGGYPIKRSGDFVRFDVEKVVEDVRESTIDGQSITERITYSIEPCFEKESSEKDSSKEDSYKEDGPAEDSFEENEPVEEDKPVEEDGSAEDTEKDASEGNAPEGDSSEGDVEEISHEEGVSRKENASRKKNVSPETQEEGLEEENSGEAGDLLEELSDRGVESSSDLNLSQLEPLVEERGEELTEEFFEGDSRKGAQKLLESLR